MTITVDLVVFDLDGTLADSLPDLAHAANHACRRLGLPEHSPAAIKDMIGGGERQFAARFLGPARQDLLEEGLRLYLEYYFTHCSDLTRLYPGVRETLTSISGKRLAVLSNKLQRLTEKVLAVMGIAGFFAAIRGGGPEAPLKPAAQPLLALMGDLGMTPARTLMVGDKPADVLTGRGSGAFTAAVTYGYGDPEALTAAAPDFVLSQLSQLPQILA
jgi:phosphoglycolate phosphatase